MMINDSLKKNRPVAVEFAAKFEDEWTLHWSIVTGMDKDKIYLNNPYGYKEEISYSEFIGRTTFQSFENMPIFFHFGFAFGLFRKVELHIDDSNDKMSPASDGAHSLTRGSFIVLIQGRSIVSPFSRRMPLSQAAPSIGFFPSG